MIKLLIREEYSFRTWYAELTDDEYNELLNRWNTIRGLNCLVPVTLIIPQAKEWDDFNIYDPSYTHVCHIHECDDSYIQGSEYLIPEDIDFWMAGKKYSRDEYWPNNV
jgi:hypothetical protein